MSILLPQGEFLSVYVTSQTQANLDQGSGMMAPVPVKLGETNYTDFTGLYYGYGTASQPFRAGDYSSVAIDPVTNGFWVAGEYATSSLSSSGNWSTWLQAFTVPPTATTSTSTRATLSSTTTASTASTGQAINTAVPPPDHPLSLGQALFSTPGHFLDPVFMEWIFAQAGRDHSDLWTALLAWSKQLDGVWRLH